MDVAGRKDGKKGHSHWGSRHVVSLQIDMFLAGVLDGPLMLQSGTEGYIAVIMPKDNNWMEAMPTLTEDQYHQHLNSTSSAARQLAASTLVSTIEG